MAFTYCKRLPFGPASSFLVQSDVYGLLASKLNSFNLVSLKRCTLSGGVIANVVQRRVMVTEAQPRMHGVHGFSHQSTRRAAWGPRRDACIACIQSTTCVVPAAAAVAHPLAHCMMRSTVTTSRFYVRGALWRGSRPPSGSML